MGEQVELRDLVGALWRQRLLVLLVLAVTALAGVVGWQLAPRTWTASAVLAAQVDGAGGTATGQDSPDALRGTLAELAASRGLVAEVRDQLSVPRDPRELRREISAARVEGTTLIRVTVRDRDPGVAAEIADDVVRLLPERDASGTFTFRAGDSADVPEDPSGPGWWLAAAVVAALALLVAVAGALARDRRTHTVRDGDEVEESTSAPLLAHLSAPSDPTSLPALAPGSGEAEVFRHLRLALEAETSGRVGRVVVAGICGGDVNTWVGANLAISLADGARRVLLVDGRLQERAGRPGPDGPGTPGLHDVLAGTPLDDALSPGPAPGLTVLPPGTATGPEPTDRLVATRFGAAMADAQARHDAVVVLAPSLDVSDDARTMAAGASLLLVLPEGGVTSQALRAHAARVRAVGAGLVGVVLVGPAGGPRS